MDNVMDYAIADLPQHRPSRRLRSPLVWFGGKGILARKIVSLFPPHHTYVEPFCGGASCLFAKPPSPVEVINDVDSDIVNFFRVLRDPPKFEQFYRLAALTPYSREEYHRYRDEWRAGWRVGWRSHDSRHDVLTLSDVERAYRWYVVARMSFAGELGRSWGHSVGTSRLGMANAVAQWLSIVDMLPEIAERAKSVQVEQGDWRDVVQAYDGPDTLFYSDPPFVRSTRRSGRYRFEMADADHERLVEVLLSIKGKVLLSGYRNDIYSVLEGQGWRRVDISMVCFAAGRTRRAGLQGRGSLSRRGASHVRTESVWISPAARMPPGQLSPAHVQGLLDLGI
jgi:DNA adenine methylase